MATNARRLRGGLGVLALALASFGPAGAHGAPGAFADSFDTLGPLRCARAIDPYECKAGAWTVVDQPAFEGSTTASSNKILVQGSKDITPNEPMVLLRARSFRSVTIQVTAAYMDVTDVNGDPPAGTSVGIVFRAPIFGGIADKDNTYLFSAHVAGVSREFPTGKFYALQKRVGRGYFPLATQAPAHLLEQTRDNLAEPHDYKIVMGGGRIQAYVDGRKIIDHVDLPSGDQATLQDPFPGLPYDQGAVGLRTSGTRAWFDNFKVAGNDAYEGRASAVNVFSQYGVDGDVKRGEAMSAYETFSKAGTTRPDTGYAYHDHAFDDAVLRPASAPGGEPSVGAALRTSASGDAVRSELRLSGVSFTFVEPGEKVTVALTADSIEVAGTASCSDRSSVVRLVNAALTVTISGTAPLPDTTLGPFALQPTYAPDTEIAQLGGVYSIVAHPTDNVRMGGGTGGNDLLNRVDVSALRIVIRDTAPTVPSVNLPGNNRTPSGKANTPPITISIGNVVAGRYCS